MRRKPGTLVPLERAICQAALTLQQQGEHEFHGYLIAKTLTEVANTRLLTGYGSLYRALARLAGMGLLESRWEDPLIAAGEGRPVRRFYSLTPAGRTASESSDLTI